MTNNNNNKFNNIHESEESDVIDKFINIHESEESDAIDKFNSSYGSDAIDDMIESIKFENFLKSQGIETSDEFKSRKNYEDFLSSKSDEIDDIDDIDDTEVLHDLDEIHELGDANFDSIDLFDKTKKNDACNYNDIVDIFDINKKDLKVEFIEKVERIWWEWASISDNLEHVYNTVAGFYAYILIVNILFLIFLVVMLIFSRIVDSNEVWVFNAGRRLQPIDGVWGTIPATGDKVVANNVQAGRLTVTLFNKIWYFNIKFKVRFLFFIFFISLILLNLILIFLVLIFSQQLLIFNISIKYIFTRIYLFIAIFIFICNIWLSHYDQTKYSWAFFQKEEFKKYIQLLRARLFINILFILLFIFCLNQGTLSEESAKFSVNLINYLGDFELFKSIKVNTFTIKFFNIFFKDHMSDVEFITYQEYISRFMEKKNNSTQFSKAMFDDVCLQKELNEKIFITWKNNAGFEEVKKVNNFWAEANPVEEDFDLYTFEADLFISIFEDLLLHIQLINESGFKLINYITLIIKLSEGANEGYLALVPNSVFPDVINKHIIYLSNKYSRSTVEWQTFLRIYTIFMLEAQARFLTNIVDSTQAPELLAKEHNYIIKQIIDDLDCSEHTKRLLKADQAAKSALDNSILGMQKLIYKNNSAPIFTNGLGDIIRADRANDGTWFGNRKCSGNIYMEGIQDPLLRNRSMFLRATDPIQVVEDALVKGLRIQQLQGHVALAKFLEQMRDHNILMIKRMHAFNKIMYSNYLQDVGEPFLKRFYYYNDEFKVETNTKYYQKENTLFTNTLAKVKKEGIFIVDLTADNALEKLAKNKQLFDYQYNKLSRKIRQNHLAANFIITTIAAEKFQMNYVSESISASLNKLNIDDFKPLEDKHIAGFEFTQKTKFHEPILLFDKESKKYKMEYDRWYRYYAHLHWNTLTLYVDQDAWLKIIRKDFKDFFEYFVSKEGKFKVMYGKEVVIKIINNNNMIQKVKIIINEEYLTKLCIQLASEDGDERRKARLVLLQISLMEVKFTAIELDNLYFRRILKDKESLTFIKEVFEYKMQKGAELSSKIYPKHIAEARAERREELRAEMNRLIEAFVEAREYITDNKQDYMFYKKYIKYEQRNVNCPDKSVKESLSKCCEAVGMITTPFSSESFVSDKYNNADLEQVMGRCIVSSDKNQLVDFDARDTKDIDDVLSSSWSIHIDQPVIDWLEELSREGVQTITNSEGNEVFVTDLLDVYKSHVSEYYDNDFLYGPYMEKPFPRVLPNCSVAQLDKGDTTGIINLPDSREEVEAKAAATAATNKVWDICIYSGIVVFAAGASYYLAFM